MSKLLFMTIFLIGFTNISDISRINQLKQEAETAFKNKQYNVAATRYKALVDSFQVSEEAIWLNMAHCYYQLKDSTNAKNAYGYLSNHTDNEVRSIANMQLGNIKAWTQDVKNYEDALLYYKRAIKADPENNMARQNYEMVKKLLEKLKQQQNQDQQNQDKDKNQDQQNQDKNQQNQDKNQQNKNQNQQNQDKKDQKNAENKDKKDGKEGKDKQNQDKKEKDQESKKDKKDGKEEQKKQDAKDPKGEQNGREDKKDASDLMPDLLKEINLSQDQAKMLLEAMKNQEIQYLQQKSRPTQKRSDKSKPDW